MRGRWALIFRQTVAFPWNNSYSIHDPSAPNFDELGSLSKYLEYSREGRLTFILNYPKMLIGTSKMQMWSQWSNPAHEKIWNYRPLLIDCHENNWGGLGPSDLDYMSFSPVELLQTTPHSPAVLIAVH